MGSSGRGQVPDYKSDDRSPRDFGDPIEVGPQQVLTRLNRQIVSAPNVAMLATDHPKKNPLETLLRIRAKLETCGWQCPTPTPSVVLHPLASHSYFEIEHFDATVRRREGAKRSKPRSPATYGPDTSSVAIELIEEFDATRARAERRSDASRSDASNRHTAGVKSQHEDSRVESSHSNPLERFLIDFVVDQTGYPDEIIELDWDLEADLGIDSIK